MANIDEQFVEFIVKSLVGNPGEVVIDRSIDEKGVLLELTVDPEDLGRVIGKRGATAQSIRTLLRALGTKNDARYNLKIVDNGEPRPRRNDDDRNDGDRYEQDNNQQQNDNSQHEDSDVGDDTTSDDDRYEDEPVVEAGEETLAEKTRKELADLDDLDI